MRLAAMTRPLPAPKASQAIPWSAAVFARNEAPLLERCLQALARAGSPHVTVLVNGSTDGSAAMAGAALRAAGLRGRVYSIAHGDKSNAFNQFIHRLRPPAETYFFVDAYAAVAPGALDRLAAGLRAAPQAQAAAALPSTGRSAGLLRRRMQEEGGLHGSLFALRGRFVERLAAAGLHLPLGFYRGDGLVGALVLHDLDAAHGGWAPERIALVPEATWDSPALRPWRPADARRYWRRLVQQGRGRLQWAALRQAIYPAGFGALPADADRQVLNWIAEDPATRRPRPWRDPFAALALRRMAKAGHPAPLTARMVAEVAKSCPWR